MRKELLYNPRLVLERLAQLSSDKRRKDKLKHTVAADLQPTQYASLEFLEMAKATNAIETVYDMGANVGTWTLLAKAILPQVSVHAFEPIPEYQDKYTQNTKGLENVTLHKVGVGPENKKERFNFAHHSSSFLEVSEALTSIFPSEKKTGEFIVDMIRVDDYISQFGLKYPDIMKLDVEGFELEALKGATECMKHCKFMILEVSFIERHIGQPLFHDVIHFLAQHDFEIYSFPERMHLAQRIIVADVFFKNRNFVV